MQDHIDETKEELEEVEREKEKEETKSTFIKNKVAKAKVARQSATKKLESTTQSSASKSAELVEDLTRLESEKEEHAARRPR